MEIKLECKKCGKKATRTLDRNGSYIGYLCCLQYMKKQTIRNRYKKAYETLMDYYNELSPESREEIDKELKELDL